MLCIVPAKALVFRTFYTLNTHMKKFTRKSQKDTEFLGTNFNSSQSVRKRIVGIGICAFIIVNRDILSVRKF